MPNEPILTVILPVYNAATTLDRCVRSFLPGLPTDSQVLLIDDGSTDNSGVLCDAWDSKDSRITTVHQKNAGASAARNAGLERATGRFVQFVDADDCAAPEVYGLLPRLDAEELDTLVFACQNLNAAAPNEVLPACTLETPAGWPGSVERPVLDTGVFFAPYNKFFRRSVLEAHHIRFDPALAVNEDVRFGLQFFSVCGRLAVVPEVYYWLDVSSENSLSRQFRTDLVASVRYNLPLYRSFFLHSGLTATRADSLCHQVEAQAAQRQFQMLTARKGPPDKRRQALSALLKDPVCKAAILDLLAHDPNRTPAIALAAFVRTGQAALLARVLQSRIPKE